MTLAASQSPDFPAFMAHTQRSFDAYVQAAIRRISSLTLEGLSQSASRHPDGFLKMHIGPKDGILDGQVRIHFWIPGTKGTEQPHSHPWHLGSKVLFGCYKEHLVQPAVDAEGELKKYRVSYPPHSDARASVEPAEPLLSFRADKGELHAFAAGEEHYLAAGNYHMSVPDGAGAITLAVMSRRFADASEFLAPIPTTFDPSVTGDDAEKAWKMVETFKRYAL